MKNPLVTRPLTEEILEQEHGLERMIGNLLRSGVIISAIVVLTGAVTWLAEHGAEHADYRVFHSRSDDLTTVPAILRDALELHSPGIIQLGLLLLVLTPVMRVIFSAVGFAMERDWLYLAITISVLAVLLFSLLHMN
jgi:uncharacterized membrane protein